MTLYQLRTHIARWKVEDRNGDEVRFHLKHSAQIYAEGLSDAGLESTVSNRWPRPNTFVHYGAR